MAINMYPTTSKSALLALLCIHSVAMAAYPPGTIATAIKPSVTLVASPIAATTTTTTLQTAWGQCGGIGWTGPIVCISGNTCTYANDWFSQCLPVATMQSSTSAYLSLSKSTPITTTSNTTIVIQTPPPSSTISSQNPTDILNGPRTTDILADIRGIYGLPTQQEVVKNATLNVKDIQGDILIGMKKNIEVFYFFQINDPVSFKKKLHNYLVNNITSTYQLLNVATQPIVCLNLAFTQTGFTKLGINASLNDQFFSMGQFADAYNLGDPGSTNWVPQFRGKAIHGVFLIATDQQLFMNAQITVINNLFGTDITELYQVDGHIRPPPYNGHEMFGFLDGIGQPAVSGFTITPVPGQEIINPGIILLGEPGDTMSRPSWAKDGSFLVFRQLQQLVPEFDDFVVNNAPPVTGLTASQASDLFGARMIGRWKSGEPVDLSPLFDNPAQAVITTQNNNFDYTHPGSNLATDQSYCPFSAHIRKSRTRADLADNVHVIMRAGIPYGPEPSSSEIAAGKSDPKLERGLAFVSYQSQIDQGFRFIQTRWENDPKFVPGKNVAPGWDPIMGEANGAIRWFTGADPNNPTAQTGLPMDFVVSRGGEYFFSPSISAIRNFISV